MKIYNEIILKWNDVTKQYDTLYEDSYEEDNPYNLPIDDPFHPNFQLPNMSGGR